MRLPGGDGRADADCRVLRDGLSEGKLLRTGDKKHPKEDHLDTKHTFLPTDSIKYEVHRPDAGVSTVTAHFSRRQPVGWRHVGTLGFASIEEAMDFHRGFSGGWFFFFFSECVETTALKKLVILALTTAADERDLELTMNRPGGQDAKSHLASWMHKTCGFQDDDDVCFLHRQVNGEPSLFAYGGFEKKPEWQESLKAQNAAFEKLFRVKNNGLVPDFTTRPRDLLRKAEALTSAA